MYTVSIFSYTHYLIKMNSYFLVKNSLVRAEIKRMVFNKTLCQRERETPYPVIRTSSGKDCIRVLFTTILSKISNMNKDTHLV